MTWALLLITALHYTECDALKNNYAADCAAAIRALKEKGDGR